jgi:hypothetical protein
MASLAQSEKGGFVATYTETRMRLEDSLRFHARLDVQSKDAMGAFLMSALTRQRKAKRMTPKEKIKFINTIIGA